MDRSRIEDVGAPNPRQAEVDRIRDAAAASGTRARASDRAVPLRTGGTDQAGDAASHPPRPSRNDD